MFKKNEFSLHLIPSVILLFTFSLPLLHFGRSRVYNFQVAIVELFIIAAAFTIYRKSLLEHFIKPSFGKLLLYAFLLFALASTIFSDYLRHSTQRYLAIIIWIAFFWLVVFLIQRKQLTANLIYITLSTSTLIPIATFSYYYFTLPPQSFEGLFKYHIYFYSNVRHFGYHLTSVTILSFYFVLKYPRNSALFAFGLSMIFLNFSLLFWTTSRQGILLSVTFSLLIIYLYYKEEWRKISLLFIAGLILSFTLLSLLGLDERILDRLYSSTVEVKDINQLSAGRVEIWLRTIEFIKNKWLLGHGSESFYHLYGEKQIFKIVHPHSFILQSLLAWGVLGSILLFLLIARLFFRACNTLWVQGVHNNEALFIAFITLLSIFANALIDGTLYHVLPIYIFSLMAALIVGNPKLKIS